MPLRDAAGKVLKWFGTCTDIHNSKLAEETLRRSQAEFKDLFDNAPVGFHENDTAGRIVRVNNTKLKMLGYTAGELLGQFVWKISADEELSRRAALAQLAGETVPPSEGVERMLRRKDGSTFPALIKDQLLQSEDGAITGIRAAIQDITERNRAEEALRQSEARLQEAQRIASMGSYSHDIASGQWSSSPALDDLFGIDASYERSVAGWAALVHPDDRAMIVGHFENEVLGQHRPFNKEYRIVRHNDQAQRWMHALGKLEFDAAGHPVTMAGTIQDITERRKLEEQFRQAQKMEGIGQLAGGVAHDFNNILAVIQLQAGLLKAEKGLSTEQLDYARDIELAAQRGANLTHQLLLFSRKQIMQPQNLKLKDVVENMAKMLRRTLGEQVELQFKFAPETLFIHADPGMIDQILLNLTVNARDAMPKGGQIIIETSAAEFNEVTATHSPQARPGSFACLTVSDTGSGIPPEILPRIFEPFFTTKEVGKGTGLGLATVFGIVQQHQGWINVYSEVGRGTTFQIYLPRAAKTSDTEFFWSAAAPLHGGKETILLVEDEAGLRAVVRTALSRLGYRVLEAANGAAALTVWQQHRAEIQLLLTDLVMPGGMTGKEVAQTLLQENPKLKVIYASGYSVEVAGKDLLLEEGVNFLAKPFQTHKLAHIIRKRLDQD